MALVDVAADLTVSIGGRTVRIHGENNDLAVDADSWRPLLALRSVRRLVTSVRGVVPFADGRLRVKVRQVPVLTVRLEGDRQHTRVHPLGLIRSFWGR